FVYRLSFPGRAAHRDLHSFPTRRSSDLSGRLRRIVRIGLPARDVTEADVARIRTQYLDGVPAALAERELLPRLNAVPIPERMPADRKSTRLNSSHVKISYAVFCLKKKKK